jgi:hypothetical protein
MGGAYTSEGEEIEVKHLDLAGCYRKEKYV